MAALLCLSIGIFMVVAILELDSVVLSLELLCRDSVDL